MSGAIPPLPNKPSWRSAQLKHRDNFTFYYYDYEIGLGKTCSMHGRSDKSILEKFKGRELGRHRCR
jgi:hypothetical protein